MRKKFLKKRIFSFREKIYRIVSDIPKGKVLTYKEVAKLSGRPRAWRVVGNFLNKNPDLVLIPCHRVIRSDNRVGGYRGGTKRKIILLRKEGIIINSRGKVKQIFINF